MCMPDWAKGPDRWVKSLEREGRSLAHQVDDAGRSIHKGVNNILGRTNQREAQWRAQNAAHADALNAQAAASAEAAETPKEATPIEADEAAAVSFARKRMGIQSTQLNTHLG